MTLLNSAKVSIIVPVYNVENCLANCLNSLCNQTLLDIEILCVNNNSTDSSQAILQQFAAQDPRIVLLDQQTKGPGAARNTGLEHAAGEIVMFCDSDDCFAPNACEKVWCEFQESATDAVVFNASLFPELGEIPSWLPWHLNLRPHEYASFSPEIIFKTPGAFPFVWRNAFSNKLLKTCGVRFAEDMMLAEDALFLMEVYPHVTQRISVLADRLYRYRWIRKGSLMDQSGLDQEQKMAAHLELIRRGLAYYEKNKFLDLYGVPLLEWILTFYVPDARSAKVKDGDMHLKLLTAVLEEKGALRFLSGIRGPAKDAAKHLKR